MPLTPTVYAALKFADAQGADIAQWLVTELIAPPTRALQLHLFSGGRDGV